MRSLALPAPAAFAVILLCVVLLGLALAACGTSGHPQPVPQAGVSAVAR